MHGPNNPLSKSGPTHALWNKYCLLSILFNHLFYGYNDILKAIGEENRMLGTIVDIKLT